MNSYYTQETEIGTGMGLCEMSSSVLIVERNFPIRDEYTFLYRK